jgi:hypothetical protein
MQLAKIEPLSDPQNFQEKIEITSFLRTHALGTRAISMVFFRRYKRNAVIIQFYKVIIIRGFLVFVTPFPAVLPCS